MSVAEHGRVLDNYTSIDWRLTHWANLVGVFVLTTVLSGCEPTQRWHSNPSGVCGSLTEQRIELSFQRSAALKAMEHDVNLGLHSVPGQTLNSVGLREAEAYVQRVRDRWNKEDAQIARRIVDLDASLNSSRCGPL